MKLIILISISIFTNLGLYSQVLNNQHGEAFTDKPFFNDGFIKENKVKKLSGYYVYKKRGQLMKETEYRYEYEFNRDGHLISTFETKADDGTVDTTWNLYDYDANGNLTVHRKTEQDGFNSIYFGYDSLNRIVSEEFKREIDTGNHVIIKSLSFNKETIEYKNPKPRLKRTRFNSYDLPYLDEFFHYNELGYLVERIERIKMTSDVYTYHYEYNENGKLSAIKKSSNRKDGYLEEMYFRYDELGNLIEKHLYKDGVFTTDYQIIYNSKTKLLSTVITRQVSTGFLMILRFKDYEFYD